MGKDKKKGIKGNVFKVAGAKSLKKTKAKAVNLGLKNMKQRIAEIDQQLLDIKSIAKTNQNKKKADIKGLDRKIEENVTKEDVANTTEKIVKLDL